LATHTSIAELIKERTDNPQFLEFLQAEQELVNYQVNLKKLSHLVFSTILLNINIMVFSSKFCSPQLIVDEMK
jgi:hypothetical protein